MSAVDRLALGVHVLQPAEHRGDHPLDHALVERGVPGGASPSSVDPNAQYSITTHKVERDLVLADERVQVRDDVPQSTRA